jgi:hypothetical protein
VQADARLTTDASKQVIPGTMHFRAYILNDHGRIFNFAELEADGDDDAKRQARHLRDGFDVEVWQLDRKVAVLKAIR